MGKTMRFWIPAFAGMTLLVACAPREWILPKVGIDPPALRDFPADFKPPLSNETNQPMVGFGGNGGGVHHTPVIFIHGNNDTPFPTACNPYGAVSQLGS